MKSAKIIIKTESKSYPIYIGDKIINNTNALLKKNLPMLILVLQIILLVLMQQTQIIY